MNTMKQTILDRIDTKWLNRVPESFRLFGMTAARTMNSMRGQTSDLSNDKSK